MGLLAWAASPLQAAADHAVTPVSYTTGEAGHQLKWLPARTAAGQRVAEPRTALPSVNKSAVRTVAAEQPLELTAPADSALANPFGDKAPQAAPPALLGDKNALMVAPLEPPAAAQSTPPAEATPPAQNHAEPEIPSLQEEMAIARGGLGSECGSLKLKSIREIDYRTAPEGGEFPPECPLADERYVPRSWPCTTFTWTASSLCHKPLYFEQVQLERYGHSWGPILQPVLSGAHFFVTIPILPYMMGVYPPNECIYTLGYYRPGNCAPYMLDPIPLSVRGALYEGGAVTGVAFLVP